MSGENRYYVTEPLEGHRYPASHWDELSRFVTGQERDPKEAFCLAEDMWDVWSAYVSPYKPTMRSKYRFRFQHLRSFLKPYVKWFCYHRLLARGEALSVGDARVPYLLTPVDTYLVEHHIQSLDEITSIADFTALWRSLLLPLKEGEGIRSEVDVKRQSRTRSFWTHLRVRFEAPHEIPPSTPFKRRSPTQLAFDESKIIPLPVIWQLTNKLALHREERELLNRFHHLRLCVLVLSFALGRRINELLAAPRGVGSQGPLSYYPAKDGLPKGALWFHFSPNKGGLQEYVYVSSEWEDTVHYCVQELVRYSDEVRDAAPVEERELLILISRWNQTSGGSAARAHPATHLEDFSHPRNFDSTSGGNQIGMQKHAGPLSYATFYDWLNDHIGWHATETVPGILRRWQITVDGSANGDIYRLLTQYARHTRQSAISSDSRVSSLSRQRDLNHTSPEMQAAYQHHARKQNEELLAKARSGQLVGPAIPWLCEMYGTSYNTTDPDTRSQFQQGTPQPLSPRWRNLIHNNPQFLQWNRVSCGYCALPQGPSACKEFRNCMEADDGGCQWFATDPSNEQMLIQISRRASLQRKQQRESATSGYIVQADKYGILAQRAEAIEEEVLRKTTQEMRDRLKARKREIEEEE